MNERAFFEGLGWVLCKSAGPVVPPVVKPSTPALPKAPALPSAPTPPSITQRNAPSPSVSSKTVAFPDWTYTPGSPTISRLDTTGPEATQYNAYHLDGLLPSRVDEERSRHNEYFTSPEEVRNRVLGPPTQPNTLNISAHGAGKPGNFKLTGEYLGQTPFAGMREIMPLEPTTIPDIAKKIGPGTNNIHNINSIACNREGGCTPEILQEYFPNVTNIMQTPPGFVGPILPRSPALLRFLNQPGASSGKFSTPEEPWNAPTDEQTRASVEKMVNMTSKNENPTRVSLPHRYALTGGKWTDTGVTSY